MLPGKLLKKTPQAFIKMGLLPEEGSGKHSLWRVEANLTLFQIQARAFNFIPVKQKQSQKHIKIIN